MPKRNVVLVEDKLSEVLDEFYFNPDTPLDDRMEVLANLFTEQAVRAMSQMSAKDAMIGAGIAVDKMNLLRGLPTEIRESIPLLIQIAMRLADENINLKLAMTKYLKALDE